MVALCLAHRRTGEQALADAAAKAGDTLLTTAARSSTGWSWSSPGLRNRHDLTGLSHGTAGVAVALTDLHLLTGEPRYAKAARQALRHESHWFDREEGNWPDFREHPGRARTFATLWCHGAPGIALSRLFCHEHLGDPGLADDARVALATTERATALMLDAGGNFSLCHGLAGNAECLLGGPSPIPAEVAAHGASRYARTGIPWPCGTHTTETPA